MEEVGLVDVYLSDGMPDIPESEIHRGKVDRERVHVVRVELRKQVPVELCGGLPQSPPELEFP